MGFYIRALITAPNYEEDSEAGKQISEHLDAINAAHSRSLTQQGDDAVWFVEQKNLDVDALIDVIRAAPWEYADPTPNVQLFVRTDADELFTEVVLWPNRPL